MASISATEAKLLSVASIPGRYYYDCRPTDQLFDLLPFKPIEGHELQLNVVTAAATLGLSGYADAETEGSALNATMPTIASRTFALTRIAGELPVASKLVNIYGSHRDLVQALLSLKVNAVRDEFKRLLVYGNSATAGEFDGLQTFAEANSQSLGAFNADANGGTVLLAELEELLAMVKPRSAGLNTFLVMNSDAYAHLRRQSYTDVEYARHPVLGTVPTMAGAPVLLNDFITSTETKGTSGDTTSIYAAVLGSDVGACGLYPSAVQGQPIQVRGPVVKEATDTMWYHVSWDVGLAFYTKCCVARLNGVKQSN